MVVYLMVVIVSKTYITHLFSQSIGLSLGVHFVSLGYSSRLKKAPFHRPLESKKRAAKKNSSSFFVFYVPSLHAITSFVRQG
jgi:hypothetical protein